VKRFSDSTTDIDNVNPRDLDGDAMEIASTFLMTTKSSGLLVDGVDFLVKENGFDAVLAFIRRLNDLAAIHNATVILWADKASLPEDEFKKVVDEFDETHDYL
jgi:archaellum biogenesis ATPase FlaH